MYVWLVPFTLGAVFAFNSQHSQSFLDTSDELSEDATANDTSSIEYNCSETDRDHVEYVCKACNATTAYLVTNASTSGLSAYTTEQQTQLQAMIDEFQSYYSSADYVAGAEGNLTCLSAFNIVNLTDKASMWQDITEEQYPDIAHPEIFNLTDSDLDLYYIGAKSNGTAYSNYTEQSDTNVTGKVGSKAKFQCTTVRLREVDDGAEAKYSGTANYTYNDTTTYSLPYVIVVDDNRTEGSVYVAVVDVNGTFTYKEWNDLIDSKANCSAVERPSNMSSLDDLEIEYSELTMKTKNNKTEVKQAHSYFDSVSFAGGYGMFLYSNQGKAVIKTSSHYCYNAFLGNWTSGEKLFTATFLNKDAAYYYLEANLYDRSNLTLTEVQDNLVNKLYLDPVSILPEYEARESAISRALWPTAILDPLVKVFYEGEAKFRVEGEGYLDAVKSLIEVRVSRVEGVVTGLTKIYQLEDSVELATDPAFDRTEQHVLVASSPIGFKDYPFMRPKEATDYSFVDVGYWYEVTLTMNDACSSSTFCSLVKDHSEEKTSSIHLRGSGDSDSTYLIASLSPIELDTDFKFKEDALVYDFATGVVMIVGASTVRGDSVNVLRFIGNITDVAPNASIAVVTEKLWETAFDIETLAVKSLIIKANFSDVSALSTETAEGQALLGRNCEEVEGCSSGQIEILFDQTNYQNNQFKARFANMTSFEFFNTMCDYNYSSADEVPYQLSLLDPSDGITLQYCHPNNTVSDLRGFEVKGNVSFLGIPSSMEGRLRRLGSGIMQISMNMTDFNAGTSNIKVKDASSSITVDRSKHVIVEELLGTVTFASITEETYFQVLSSGLKCDLTGYAYGGLYQAEAYLTTGAEANIEDAEFTGRLEIRQTQLADLEVSVREDLQDWINTGLNALNQSRGFVDEALEPVEQLEPNLCVEKAACGERFECSKSPEIECAQHKFEEICETEGSSCEKQTYTCSESETVCSVTKEDCDGDDCCETSVVLCHEWTNSCEDASDDNCSTYKLTSDPDKCHREELTCGLEEVPDQACKKKCQRTQFLYESAIANYDEEQAGYNQTQADLQGFRSLNNLMTANFEVAKLVEVRPR